MQLLLVLALCVCAITTDALSNSRKVVLRVRAGNSNFDLQNDEPSSITCIDGVCSLPSDNINNDDSSLRDMVLSDWNSAAGDLVVDDGPQPTYNNTGDVATLTSLGWSAEEAVDALIVCKNNMSKAAEYLEARDEEIDLRNARLKELVASGWLEKAAFTALEVCAGNATAAEILLSQEEERIQSIFNASVKGMVSGSVVSVSC